MCIRRKKADLKGKMRGCPGKGTGSVDAQPGEFSQKCMATEGKSSRASVFRALPEARVRTDGKCFLSKPEGLSVSLDPTARYSWNRSPAPRGQRQTDPNALASQYCQWVSSSFSD